MKVSKGEPESPLQEASIGVPQTPSNSELVPATVEIQGSAAWAVALKSGSAVLCRRPSHLWL